MTLKQNPADVSLATPLDAQASTSFSSPYLPTYTVDPWQQELVITTANVPLTTCPASETSPVGFDSPLLHLSQHLQTRSDPNHLPAWLQLLCQAPLPSSWREKVLVAGVATCVWWHRLEQQSAAAVGISSYAPVPKGQTPQPAAVLITGVAALVGTVGVFWGQQPRYKVAMIPPSQQLLTEVLQQNFAAKQEAAATFFDQHFQEERRGIIRHRVTENQTLWQLTQMYRVDAAAITTANGLTASSPLQPGQVLSIPAEPGIIYTVKPGDTLESIARNYQVSQREIIRATPLTDSQYLRVGQQLLIPGDVGALIALQNKLTAPAPKPAVAPPPSPRTHTVAAGETFAIVASRYGIGVDQLQQANPGVNPRRLQIGQTLQLPGSVAVATAPRPQSHTVAAGETLGSIAERYGLSLGQVQQWNPGVNSQRLQVGQQIALVPPRVPATPPQTATTHTIRAGETLGSIASRYGISLQDLQAANPQVNSQRLRVGQRLTIPGSLRTPVARRPAPVRPLVPAPAPQKDLPDPVTALVPPAPAARPTPLPDWPEPEPVTALASPAPAPAAPAPRQRQSQVGFIWPVAGRVTSGFGWRRGRLHAGVDIPGPVGTPIVAVADGVVIFAGYGRDGYGNRVDIRHPNGIVTRYAHGHRIFVTVGQQVSQGQTIMSRGSTGWSTGPHLHFEVRPGGGAAVDPMPYLP
ncbi:MAG: LysM peptidoglycan-binding domain-containing protein [Thermostichales cyanobacterium GMQP_bins_62]